MRSFVRAAAALAIIATAMAAGAQTVVSSSGSSADITPAVNEFRSDLGPLNPNVAGSVGTGRREINWDGVPDALAAPNNLPANFFNSNSPRGIVMSTPGTGFEVSANAASGTPVEFGNINATYPQLFTTFSPERLFTAIGSNIVDVNFFIPGTSTPAFTRGFGAVFTDVDIAGSTTLSFYGVGNVLLGTWNVPAIAGNETLSFLGVFFPDAVVSRVRVTSGNTALGGNESGGTDLVVMDDFIFGEPTPVPEPATWAMFLTGFAAIGLQFRRRRRANDRA